MAKIIYGVAGEGFGHSSRSHLIGRYLMDRGHEVLFAASRKSLSYLRKQFPERVVEIAGLGLVYRNGVLLPIDTLKMNLSRFLSNRAINRRLYGEVFEPFRPDLVISDFEPFSAWWAWRHDIPFISIDHQHLLTLCELEHPPEERFARLNAQTVTRCHGAGAAAYLILNFFRVPVTNPRAVLTPPVVRPTVESLNPAHGKHILVYTTDRSWKDRLATLLNSFHDQTFRVYGFDETQQIDNCEFKRTSTEQFLLDLASCRGIVTTAGFSLLSECLHLRKKCLLLPVRGQYEQAINARYAERLGLAVHRTSLTAHTLGEYFDTLETPVANHPDVLWPDNRGFFEILDRTMDEICPRRAAVSAALVREELVPR